MTDIDPQTVVDDFNTIHGSVTWVRYWTGTRDDAPKYNLTDGKAWLLGDHTPVVRVRGESSCIALTHVDVLPSQPDDIEDDSRDLPEPAQAAERVREYVSAFGDGIYDVVDGHPLYGRDLEALGRAGVEVKRLRAELNEALPQITQLTEALEKANKPDHLTAYTNEDEQYLIWSQHHQSWWGPSRSGYRRNPADAGRYTLAAAQAEMHRGCYCCRVPEVPVAATKAIGRGDRAIQDAITEATEWAIKAGQENKAYDVAEATR